MGVFVIVTCPYCGTDSPPEYNFCVNCERQIKCTVPECNALLIADKTRCLKCGHSLVVLNNAATQMNSYVRQVDQTTRSYSERTEIHASDEAIGELAPLLAGGARSLIPRPTFPNNSIKDDPTRLLDHNPNQEESSDSPKSDAKPDVYKYFVLDETGSLVAKVRDFKGASKKEQQKRLVIMTTWAYNQIHQKPVPSRDYLRVVAVNSKLHDDNFRVYVGEAIREYLSGVGSGFILSNHGEKKASQIIVDLEDDSVEGSAYWQPSSKSSKKIIRTSKEDQQKIEEWAASELDLGRLDIRSLGSPRNYAMFALWAITVKLQKATLVKPKEAYLFIKSKYETIPVAPDEFTKVLSRKLKGNGSN